MAKTPKTKPCADTETPKSAGKTVELTQRLNIRIRVETYRRLIVQAAYTGRMNDLSAMIDEILDRNCRDYRVQANTHPGKARSADSSDTFDRREITDHVIESAAA